MIHPEYSLENELLQIYSVHPRVKLELLPYYPKKSFFLVHNSEDRIAGSYVQ